jgi:hypothetical protein
MKRAVVFVTLAAVLATACKKSPEVTAAATAEEQTEAVKTGPLPHPLFWSVESAGKTTYFLGTMHTGIDANTRLPAIVWNKFHAAKTFAMETDLDDPEAASMLSSAASSLRRDLGEVYWKKLEDAMGPSVASALEHLPPMVPAAKLAMRGLPPSSSMDRTLSARAASEHKQLVYLEPVTRQLAILGKWMDVKALKMMLDELPESELRARAMLDAYVEGDENKMIAISDQEKANALQHGYTAAEYDQAMDELLYNRNASWLEPIEKLHAGGGGFVAVGAMHLLGQRSVLALLAHKGYQVTRISP